MSDIKNSLMNQMAIKLWTESIKKLEETEKILLKLDLECFIRINKENLNSFDIKTISKVSDLEN